MRYWLGVWLRTTAYIFAVLCSFVIMVLLAATAYDVVVSRFGFVPGLLAGMLVISAFVSAVVIYFGRP